jgi:chromosome segregation ATPase
MSTNVHLLGSRSTPADGAYTELSKILTFVNWNLQVQTILEAAGIPHGSEMAEDPGAPIPAGTKAHSFGHQTLGSFIKSGAENQGLNRDWAEWASLAKASRFKQTFNIYSDTPKEIIAQVEDVSATLGRMPYSAVEYHQQKDLILQHQRRDSDRRSKMQSDEMNEKITDLMTRVNKEKSHSEDLTKRAADTQLKLDAARREMEEKLTEARLNHDRDLERKLTAQKAEIESAFHQELGEMRKQADMRIRESQERLQEMTEHYAKNFVSKSDHEIVSEQLTRAREENFQLIGSLKETSSKLESTMGILETERRAFAEEQSRVTALSSEVERLTSRMNTIVRTPYLGSDNEIVAELQTQIDSLMLDLQGVTTESKKLKQQKRGLEKHLNLYKQRLQEATDVNAGLTTKLKKMRTTVKIHVNELSTMKKNMWAISAILAVSVITTGLLIVVA